jgi:hypothetical protein
MPHFDPELVEVMRDALDEVMTKVPSEYSTPATKAYLAQGNESRLTRLWLQRAENVQQVLRVPGGALAATLD